MPSGFPRVGSHVDTSSYTVCEKSRDHIVHLVSTGFMITNCSPSTQQFRYVIVQILGRGAKRLCIAEVAVYEGGLYASTIVF